MAADDVAPYDPKPIPAEPEQMAFWRRILAYRDGLVSCITTWDDYFAKQRHGVMQRHLSDQIEATAISPEAEKPPDVSQRLAAIEGSLRRSEALLDPVRKELADLDEEILKGSSEDSTRRGLRMPQLRRLAERDQRPKFDVRRDQLLLMIEQYLKEKGDPESRETVEAMLLEYTGKNDFDLERLNMDARAQRIAAGGSGTRREIAKRMLDLAVQQAQQERQPKSSG